MLQELSLKIFCFRCDIDAFSSCCPGLIGAFSEWKILFVGGWKAMFVLVVDIVVQTVTGRYCIFCVYTCKLTEMRVFPFYVPFGERKRTVCCPNMFTIKEPRHVCRGSLTIAIITVCQSRI